MSNPMFRTHASDHRPNFAVKFGQWCEAFGWSLLLSTAAVLAITAALMTVYPVSQVMTVSKSPLVITSCVAAMDGEHLLATCRAQTGDRRAFRSLLVSVNLTGRSPCATLVPMSFPIQELVASREGDLAFAAGQNWLELRSIISGESRQGSLAIPTLPEHTAVSLDGRWLITCDQHVRVVDLKTNKMRWQRDDLEVTNLIISPHGRLLCVLNKLEIVELSPDSPEIKRSILRCSERLSSIAVDPRGVLMACLYASGKVEMRTLREGKLLWTRAAHGTLSLPSENRAHIHAEVLCFSPDGYDLVTAASEGEWLLAVWDVASGDRVQSLRGHDGHINGATYLPDGTLVSWGGDGTVRVWDVPRGFARRIISLAELLSC